MAQLITSKQNHNHSYLANSLKIDGGNWKWGRQTKVILIAKIGRFHQHCWKCSRTQSISKSRAFHLNNLDPSQIVLLNVLLKILYKSYSNKTIYCTARPGQRYIIYLSFLVQPVPSQEPIAWGLICWTDQLNFSSHNTRSWEPPMKLIVGCLKAGKQKLGGGGMTQIVFCMQYILDSILCISR